MGKKSVKVVSVGRMPKIKCCESKSKCGRCPLRMLKEGTLPTGYAVKKRRLVHADDLEPVKKSQLSKKGVTSVKASKVAKVAKATKASKQGKKGSKRRLAAAA